MAKCNKYAGQRSAASWGTVVCVPTGRLRSVNLLQAATPQVATPELGRMWTLCAVLHLCSTRQNVLVNTMRGFHIHARFIFQQHSLNIVGHAPSTQSLHAAPTLTFTLFLIRLLNADMLFELLRPLNLAHSQPRMGSRSTMKTTRTSASSDAKSEVATASIDNAKGSTTQLPLASIDLDGLHPFETLRLTQ